MIGLGNIGRQAAERAVGLKMNVIGYDPFPPKELPAGVKQVSLDELIAQSDYITLHVPLTHETKGLFNAATIAKMKKGACLINCARGGIVDENAVLEALKSGQLGGAALDVFAKEPPDPSPLFAAREPDRRPAPGGVDQGGAGEGGDRDGRGVRRLPQGRRRPQRGQVGRWLNRAAKGPTRRSSRRPKPPRSPARRASAAHRACAITRRLAAAARLRVIETLLAEFDRAGFERVITPAFEYEEVLALGLGAAARAVTVRFVEPSSGQVVALRPDITPQIARLIATRFRDEKGPVRLCYEGTVVRLDRAARGQRELIQAGVELAGLAGPDGDAELIALAVEALAAAGLPRPTIDLGHLGLAREVLARWRSPSRRWKRRGVASPSATARGWRPVLRAARGASRP